MSRDDDPDARLLADVAAGDARAARAMVTAKLPRMLALAQRMLGDPAEAEDVAQEAMLRLWRQAPRWRRGEARVDTWLHRVALNLCYDRLRRRREVTMAEPPDGIDPAPLPDTVLAGLEEGEAVGRALAALPPRQREAIVLVYYQALPGGEAAAAMGVSVDALESLLARGRRGLKALLGRMEDE